MLLRENELDVGDLRRLRLVNMTAFSVKHRVSLSFYCNLSSINFEFPIFFRNSGDYCNCSYK